MRHFLKCLFVSLLLHAILLTPLLRTLLPSSQPSGLSAGKTIRASLALQAHQQTLGPVEDDSGESEVLSRRPDIVKRLNAGEVVSKPIGDQAMNSEMAPEEGEFKESAVVDRPLAQEAIDQYRLNLARAARMFRQYPASARSAGQEGRAVVVVSTAAGALRPRVSLSQSSGYEILDAHAIKMVDQAVSIAELPVGLRGGVFALTLPILFSVADTLD